MGFLKELIARDNENFKEAKRHFPNKLSSGELILQIAQRIFNVLDEIKEKYLNQNVLIVTYGGVSWVKTRIQFY
jgi:broad specificity phosphatase PhoE